MSTGRKDLERENEGLSRRLEEAEQALDAIRNGEVDAIIVSAGDRHKIYTLESPDLPYRQIVETMNAGAVTLNRAGTVLYANGVFADMLKRRVETVIGARFRDFVSPAHRGRLSSFLREPARHSDEMALVTQSGEELFVQLSWSIQAAGGPPRTCLVATDISRRVSAEKALLKARDELEANVAERTAELLWANDLLQKEIEERKRAEEALRRSRGELEQRVRERTKILQRQASLLDLAHNAVLVRDMENRITFWNRGAEEMYGFTAEEALGNASDMLLKTEFPAPLDDVMREVNQAGRWEGELIHTTKDGDRITVLSRWALQRDEAGTPSAVMEINLDITKGKQAERALQSAYVYNRSLIEASPDPIVTITAGGKIGDVNAATESITGRARDELIGTAFSDYFTEPEKARAGYRKVFDKGYVRDYPLEIRRKDGHVTEVLYNASVYRDDGGNVLGAFAAARDITQQRQMEEQLRQTHKLEAVGTLAGGIAHDFNNMLAVIIGNAELALDGVIDEATRGNLTQILGASKRSRDLVKQILTFTRKDGRKGKPVAIAPVLRDVYELLRGSLPSTIDIELKMQAKESVTVAAEPSHIEQVLVNLASNAAHAMREKGGKLSIRLSTVSGRNSLYYDEVKPGRYVKLTVRDTGTGITPEVRERMFDPFFTTKEPGEGTGMGLAVVYGIVEGCGGAITVESEPGKGAVFTVLLPQGKALGEDAPGEAEEERLDAAEKGHILFVDDEPGVVEMSKAMLERAGWRVTGFTEPGQALKSFIADPRRFDLIITDQTMPRITGLALARRAVAMRKDVPVILCTGYSEAVTPEKAKEAGIRECVLKPLSRREMFQAIARAMEETD